MRRLLQRYAWQFLPHRLRRSVLFHATALVAPRPAQDTKAALPIIVAGALRTASGLGESARLCYKALKNEGLPVYGIDIGAALAQPSDMPFDYHDGRSQSGPGTLIMHVNAPLMPLAMLRLGSVLVRRKRVVGYWAWELPQVPPDWRHGVPFVHEIWVPSRFTAAAVAPIAADRPVHVVPHPVALTRAEPDTPMPGSGARAGETRFTVVTIFNMASGFSRKNPCAAIAAFRQAFADDAGTKLIVKTSNAATCSDGLGLIRDAAYSASNIDVIDRVSDPSKIAALYEQADVVISLHRAEGFGLTIAEAMLRAKPVVATNWSGNVDFLDAGNGVPISFELIPAKDIQRTYHHPEMEWANANVAEAARALRQLRDDPALRAQLGAAAAAYAARTWSASAYGDTVRRHLGV